MLSCEAKDLAMKQMGERADPIKTNLREFRQKKKEKFRNHDHLLEANKTMA